MNLLEYCPILNKLNEDERNTILNNVKLVHFHAGDVVYSADRECLGPLVVLDGQLRGVIYSDDGKEITIYRLFERDMCLFSASCMMKSIRFNISIIADKDTTCYLIPAKIYKGIMEHSATLSNFTNEVMADRMSDVVWLIEQILWKSLDKRIATFLCDEVNIEGSNTLKITHEQIAAHLGSAREVVTRMMKYFQGEGLVSLRRGIIEVLDIDRLYELSE